MTISDEIAAIDCTVIMTTVGGPWLEEQLRALAAQVEPASEVIVVNNGVPGAVRERVEAFRERLPMLTVIDDDTVRGPAYARNMGAAAARTPGLLFIDDDDVVSPDYVKALSAALATADLVSPRIRLDLLNPPELAKDWQGLHDSGPMSHFGFLPWTFGGGLGCRSAVFEQVGGFDTALQVTEDVDLCWRAQLDAGATFAFVPEATLNYRLRLGARQAFRQSMGWAEGQVGLYRRYRTRGWQPKGRLRSAARWGRSLQLLLSARTSVERTVAARHLGARFGRLWGSIRFRCLYL